MTRVLPMLTVSLVETIMGRIELTGHTKEKRSVSSWKWAPRAPRAPEIFFCPCMEVLFCPCMEGDQVCGPSLFPGQKILVLSQLHLYPCPLVHRGIKTTISDGPYI